MLFRTSLLVLCTAAFAPCQDQSGPFFRFQVNGPVSDLQMNLLWDRFDVLECSAKEVSPPFEVLVPAEQLPEFFNLQVDAALIEQMEALLPPPSQYYTSAEIIAEMDAIVNDPRNTGIATRVDLTALSGGAITHNGNRIYALKLSDNAAVDENEPAMTFISQHHCRESNSSAIVVGNMNRVFDRYYGNANPTWGSGPVAIDPAIVNVVDNYELYFVPNANPDGLDHVWCCNTFWRKNRRNNGGSFGVDLNRNFPFLWGQCGASTSPSSDIYRGPSPGSEPETQTMIALHRFLRPEVNLDFHSFGREVLYLYPPCATVSSAIDGLADTYIDDLRFSISPSYATRFPSASGEAPHDHWASGGAMALLVEVGSSFQPSWSSTLTEEARVWPGIENTLKTWRPAIRGNVRSIFQNQPIEANIGYFPNQFSEGEKIKARPRDGRYNAYLPIGTWTVEWSAPGFKPVTKQVTVSSYNNPMDIDVDLVPDTFVDPTLTPAGTNQLGTTTTLTYNSPGDAGALYWVTMALTTSPGLDLGGCRTVPLTPDQFFVGMAKSPNILMNNHIGTLPAGDTAVANLTIPNIPALANLTIYVGGLTVDLNYNGFVKKFTPTSTQITFVP